MSWYDDIIPCLEREYNKPMQQAGYGSPIPPGFRDGILLRYEGLGKRNKKYILSIQYGDGKLYYGLGIPAPRYEGVLALFLLLVSILLLPFFVLFKKFPWPKNLTQPYSIFLNKEAKKIDPGILDMVLTENNYQQLIKEQRDFIETHFLALLKGEK